MRQIRRNSICPVLVGSQMRLGSCLLHFVRCSLRWRSSRPHMQSTAILIALEARQFSWLLPIGETLQRLRNIDPKTHTWSNCLAGNGEVQVTVGADVFAQDGTSLRLQTRCVEIPLLQYVVPGPECRCSDVGIEGGGSFVLTHCYQMPARTHVLKCRRAHCTACG